MKKFSIVRVGDEYVVQAGDKSVLKVASRQMADQLVIDAAGLLDAPPTAPASAPVESSISCDPSKVS